MTAKLSCNDSGVDESLSHVASDDDNRSNNADVDTADVNTADGAVRNEGLEHEGSTIEQSAAMSVVTGKNVCRAAVRFIFNGMTIW